MTEKRFTLYKGLDTINIMDNTKFREQIYINKSSKDMKCLVGLLNELAEENNELKEVIEEVFEMITNLDYVRKQYLNALLNILGEENDVDKTKKRIKVFLE